MLVERKEYIEKETNLTYIESIFKSENILKTTYFPHSQRLYIAFSRGDTYSYGNVSPDFYQEFENAESHGKFFYGKINKNPAYPYRREYKLLPYEIEGLKEIIENHKSEEDATDE
jgi:hypothetical protein